MQESLTGESLGKFNYQPYLRVQKVENAAKALDRIKEMGVHLTNIGPEGAPSSSLHCSFACTLWVGNRG